MSVEHLKEWKTVIDAPIAIVDFNAAWCGPCRVLKPVFETLAGQYKGKAAFIEVNVDDHQAVSEEQEIVSIPAINVYKFGKKVDGMVGANGDQLKKMVEKACA